MPQLDACLRALRRYTAGVTGLHHRALLDRWRLLGVAQQLRLALATAADPIAVLNSRLANRSFGEIEQLAHALSALGAPEASAALRRWKQGGEPSSTARPLRLAVNGIAGDPGSSPILRPLFGLVVNRAGSGGAPQSEGGDAPEGAAGAAMPTGQRRPLGREAGERPERSLRADLGKDFPLSSGPGEWPLRAAYGGVPLTIYTGVLIPPESRDYRSWFRGEPQVGEGLTVSLVWDAKRELYVLKTLNATGGTSPALVPAKTPAVRVNPPRETDGWAVGCTWVARPSQLADALRSCLRLLQSRDDGVPRGTTRHVAQQAAFLAAAQPQMHDPVGLQPMQVDFSAPGLPGQVRVYLYACTLVAAKGEYASSIVLPEHRDRSVAASPYLDDGMPTLFVGVITDGPEPLYVLWEAERIGPRKVGTPIYVGTEAVEQARLSGYDEQPRQLQKGRGVEQVIVCKAEALREAIQNRLQPTHRAQILSALGVPAPPTGALALGSAVIPLHGHAVRLHFYDSIPRGERDSPGIRPFRHGVFADRIQRAPSAYPANEPPRGVRDLLLAYDPIHEVVAIWDAARYDATMPAAPATVQEDTLARAAQDGLAVERQTVGNTAIVRAARIDRLNDAMRQLLEHPAASGRYFDVVDPGPQSRLLAQLTMHQPVDADYRPMGVVAELETGSAAFNFYLYPMYAEWPDAQAYLVRVELPGWPERTRTAYDIGLRPSIVGGWLDVSPDQFPGIPAQRIYVMWDATAHTAVGRTRTVEDRVLRIPRAAVAELLLEDKPWVTRERNLRHGGNETVIVCKEEALPQAIDLRLRTQYRALPARADQTGWSPTKLHISDLSTRVPIYALAGPGDLLYGGRGVDPDNMPLPGGGRGPLHEWIVRALTQWNGQRLVFYVPNGRNIAELCANILGCETLAPYHVDESADDLFIHPSRNADALFLKATDMVSFTPSVALSRQPLHLNTKGRFSEPHNHVVADEDVLPRHLGRLTAFNSHYCGFAVGSECEILISRHPAPMSSFIRRREELEQAGIRLRALKVFGLPAIVHEVKPE
jgi:hypothetical protein